MTTPAVKRQPIPFGKYLLLDRINIGGMAEVWRGKTFGAGGFERLVAIKRILPNIAEDQEFISMFIDEAKITVQLNHANIAQIYELSHISNSYFIAMEYIPGKDMRAIFDRCRKKGEPAPVPLTCFVISKCCEGLDYAHRKQVNGKDLGIVHRDVSPQNLLLSYEGEVKVIDFGIAKAAGKATKTQAGILKGKFGYMSPEQIRGLPLDRRSDVFAIGVCLYEMLTGERLFVGDSDFSVLEKVRKVEVLPPSTYNRKIPDALEKIVMKALAKDVDDRYQYASEVSDDLQRFLITSDSIFSRKDLAQYMKSTFAEEVEREKQRLMEYAEIQPPEGMLAAAEAGFGGTVPTVPVVGPLPSASAVTNLPSVVVPLTTPTTGPAPSLRGPSGSNPRPPPPAMTPSPVPRGSSPPPVLGPQVPQLTPPATVDRRSSGNSMPRLTAAAPMLTNVEDNQSTMLVDGQTLFEPSDDQTPSFPPQPPGKPTRLDVPMADDVVGAAPRRSSSNDTNPQATGPSAAAQHPPEDRRELPLDAEVEPTRQMPVRRTPKSATPQRSRAPAGRSQTPTAMPAVVPPPGHRRVLLPAVIGVALVALGLVALLVFKGPTEGLLLVELPPDFNGSATINVNGALLTPRECGSVPKAGPNLCRVPSGRATVVINADGYAPLMETLQVKEGTNEYSKLNQKLKKAH